MAVVSRAVERVAPDETQDLGFADLVAEIARRAVVGVAALAAGTIVLAISIWSPVPAEAFWLASALASLALVGWAAARFGVVAVGVMLSGGLGALVVVGSANGGAAWLLPWSSIVVLMGAAVAGWRFGAAVCLALTAAVVAAVAWSAEPPPTELLLSAGGLSWSTLFLYWLVSRPTDTALAWALHSYHESRRHTEEARNRQAELARLSRSLGEYSYRLEQLNLDLARARRVAEEARQLKEQFAAAVSHELRTPLNLILGFCEMMVLAPSTAYGQSLPHAYRADLEAMYRNAMHISSLVDDILDLSQIDAGRMALHREWASLPDVVAEAIATVETLFTNRGLGLRSAIPSDLPELYIDRTRIRQILINLLSNSARFLERGGATVAASLADGKVVVAVRDTGPGIPPDDLPFVFEEFRQSAAAASGHHGSGLGLTVSRRFAEMHGGAMRVESVVGQGTTFFLELPTTPPESVAPGDGEAWDERVVRRARGRAVPQIAVFDRAGQVRRLFQRHLDGYAVVDERAIVAAARRHVDLPLHAVVVGGDDDLRRWQGTVERAPHLGRLPVLACPVRTAARAGEELGARYSLTKPVARAQLRAILRELGRPVRRAVVVDDNVEMTRLLDRMLRSLCPGVEVATAHDGDGALSLIGAQPPDLVLLDLLMPRVDGYAVLQRLAAHPELRDVPVVLVTARGTHSEAVLAERLTIERAGGLTVRELMLWVRSGLEALLGPPGTDPAPTEARPA